MGNALEYREPLPDDCPPAVAEEIVAPRIVYRLVWSDPPSFDDFRSQRDLDPEGEWDVTECQARGVSVFIDRRGANKRRRGRNLKGTLICEVSLDKGAGRILQPNPKSAHCTWWPLADYNIIANCRVVE